MIPDTHGFIRYDSTNDFDFAEKIITYDLAELQSSSHMIPGQFDSLDKTAGNFLPMILKPVKIIYANSCAV